MPNLHTLEKKRKNELDNKFQMIPAELGKFAECIIFKREEYEKIEINKNAAEVIGNIVIDEEEKKCSADEPKICSITKIMQRSDRKGYRNWVHKNQI